MATLTAKIMFQNVERDELSLMTDVVNLDLDTINFGEYKNPTGRTEDTIIRSYILITTSGDFEEEEIEDILEEEIQNNIIDKSQGEKVLVDTVENTPY